MKEHPILFSASMVRALLANAKNQTRRIVKPQPAATHEYCRVNQVGPWFHIEADKPDPVMHTVRCPYGVVGDRLWVREHWGYLGCSTCNSPAQHTASALYHADNTRREVKFRTAKQAMDAGPRQKIVHPAGYDDLDEDEKRIAHYDLIDKWWKQKRSIPSIHMPRWASRITLEITDVRVERVKSISEADAAAEGIIEIQRSLYRHGKLNGYGAPGTKPDDAQSTRVHAYWALWESINGAVGPASWDVNPWVWVVEFKRVEK